MSIFNRRNPAKAATAVTKSDSDVFSPTSRAIVVGTAGDLNAVFVELPNGMPNDDNVATVIPVSAGVWPFELKQILSTSTTASGFVLLF